MRQLPVVLSQQELVREWNLYCTQYLFWILGIDITDLLLADNGNEHVVVMQDLCTKWPFVFPMPDQRAPCIAHPFWQNKSYVPWFGVPDPWHHYLPSPVWRHFNRTLKQMLKQNGWQVGSVHICQELQCNMPHLATRETFVSVICGGPQITHRNGLSAIYTFTPNHTERLLWVDGITLVQQRPSCRDDTEGW